MATEPTCILTTGGTIDKVYFDAKSEYQVGGPGIEEILQEGGARFPFRIESILRKDSLDISDKDRALIRERLAEQPEEKILITHGTDTMVETAKALVGVPGKTIVLVGSLTPANFKHSDAPFNIAFALGALQCLPHGVYIAMNGMIFHPNAVRKNRSEACFEPIIPE